MFTYAVTEDYLRINRDVYRLANLQSVSLAKHNLIQQLFRQGYLGLSFAFVGAIFLVWLGPVLVPVMIGLFFVGVAYGLLTASITELRAQIVDQSDGTRHQEILMKGRSDASLENMIAVYIDVNKRLKR
jgi:hypothetical protein